MACASFPTLHTKKQKQRHQECVSLSSPSSSLRRACEAQIIELLNLELSALWWRPWEPGPGNVGKFINGGLRTRGSVTFRLTLAGPPISRGSVRGLNSVINPRPLVMRMSLSQTNILLPLGSLPRGAFTWDDSLLGSKICEDFNSCLAPHSSPGNPTRSQAGGPRLPNMEHMGAHSIRPAPDNQTRRLTSQRFHGTFAHTASGLPIRGERVQSHALAGFGKSTGYQSL